MEGASFLTKYFLIVLLLFACSLIALNSQFTKVIVKDSSVIERHLKGSLQSFLNHKRETNNNIRNGLKSIHGNDFIEAVNSHDHRLAGLNCERWGGPSNDVAQKMVYWEDIPSDEKFVSPFRQSNTQYLTFEPDAGGWNNIR